MDDKWIWFKEFVKQMRKWNNSLIRGYYKGVRISISLIDLDRGDYIEFNPHSINLHTGETSITIDGVYQDIDVKYLVCNRRMKKEE